MGEGHSAYKAAHIQTMKKVQERRDNSSTRSQLQGNG